MNGQEKIVTKQENTESLKKASAYRANYRMEQIKHERVLEQTKPGIYIRNNPDYNLIMAAIKKEEREKNV